MSSENSPLLEHRLELLREAGADPSDEASLIKCIETSKSQFVVAAAVFMLRRVGTERSIPVLKACLQHRKYEVKHLALISLGALCGAEESELYLELLNRFTFPARWAAMYVVTLYCGEEAVESVAKKVRWDATHGSRVAPESRLVLAARFLDRYADSHPVAAEALDLVAENWNVRYKLERQLLAESVPRFAGLPVEYDS